MMYLSKFVLLVSFLTIQSEINESQIVIKNSFHTYINKFKPLKLPLYLTSETISSDNLLKSDMKSTDTLYDKRSSLIFGILPDTSHYFATVTIFTGSDDLIPILTTFDKHGKIINSEVLYVNGCGGGGPEIKYCTSSCILNQNKTFFSVDTVNISKVDSIDNPIESTRTIYCDYKNGKITNKGKIVILSKGRTKLK